MNFMTVTCIYERFVRRAFIDALYQGRGIFICNSVAISNLI